MSDPLTALGKGRASSARQLQRSHSALSSHQHTFLPQKWQQTCCEGVTGRAEALGREDTLSMGRPWPVSVCDPFQAIPTAHRSCTPSSTRARSQLPDGSSAPSQEDRPRARAQGDMAVWDSAGQQKLQSHSCCIHPGAVHAHAVGTFPGARGSRQCWVPFPPGTLHSTHLTLQAVRDLQRVHKSQLTPDFSFPDHAGPTSALQTAVLQSGLP